MKISANRRNIVVFLSDQQHAAYARNPAVCPRITRFLREGTDFPNAFTPSPICTPARASVQTGLHPHAHRLLHNTHNAVFGHPDLPEGTRTIADELAAMGYRCGYVGKWHVGKTQAPADHGYHDVPAIPRDCPPRKEWRLSDEVRIPGEPGSRGLLGARVDLDTEAMPAMSTAKTAAALLRDYADGDRPFLLFVSVLDPHVPNLVPSDIADLFPLEAIEFPDGWDAERPGAPYAWAHHYNGQNLCETPADPETMRRYLAHYCGSNRLVDDAFGHVLDALDEQGLSEETMVVYSSDHGEFAGEHGLIGKGEYLSDCLCRVPLGIRAPGARAATREDYVSLCDLFATFADWAGARGACPASSRSLIPALHGETTGFPDLCVSQHSGSASLNTVRGIRTRRYHYVFRANEPDEFYHLAEDPSERVNRIDDPSMALPLALMRRRLLLWMRDSADPAFKGAGYAMRGGLPRIALAENALSAEAEKAFADDLAIGARISPATNADATETAGDAGEPTSVPLPASVVRLSRMGALPHICLLRRPMEEDIASGVAAPFDDVIHALGERGVLPVFLGGAATADAPGDSTIGGTPSPVIPLSECFDAEAAPDVSRERISGIWVAERLREWFDDRCGISPDPLFKK